MMAHCSQLINSDNTAHKKRKAKEDSIKGRLQCYTLKKAEQICWCKTELKNEGNSPQCRKIRGIKQYTFDDLEVVLVVEGNRIGLHWVTEDEKLQKA